VVCLLEAMTTMPPSLRAVSIVYSLLNKKYVTSCDMIELSKTYRSRLSHAIRGNGILFSVPLNRVSAQCLGQSYWISPTGEPSCSFGYAFLEDADIPHPAIIIFSSARDGTALSKLASSAFSSPIPIQFFEVYVCQTSPAKSKPQSSPRHYSPP
jgi:hypothetical protein